jgi:4-amino-4-deoxy-L-arabinose transferase-like glycosyltransferase
MLRKTFKFLVEVLIILHFILLELAWFDKGVSFQIQRYSIEAHSVKRLLAILISLGLFWLFLTIPWRTWSDFSHYISHWILILLLVGSIPFVFFIKEKNALPHGLLGSYYVNKDWSGEPLFTRIDPEVSFPNHALDEFSRENYSILWTGYIRIPRTAEYTFALRSDDGSTLSIDDQLVIDNSGVHNAKTKSALLRLEEGFHAVKISYFQLTKAHLLHFYWANPKPFNWIKIVSDQYLYSEKPEDEAHQRERAMENTVLVIKIFWLVVLLSYVRAFVKNQAFREAYLAPFFLLVIFLLAVLLRLYLLEYPLGTLDSDEAIEGLMAKHILTKAARPILYYDLPYMGSLKAHLTAMIFQVFGVSVSGLKVASTLFFLAFILLMYLFTKAITDFRTALLTTLLLAVSPGFLAWRSIYAGAAYMELLAFGTALMWILTKILYPKESDSSISSESISSMPPRKSCHLRWYSLAGFLAGVGFWANPLIIYYLLTFMFLWFIKDKRFILRKSFVVFVLFFILGVFPLLLWNLKNQWATYTFLTGGEKSSWDSQLFQFPINLHNLLVEAFPILVGALTHTDMINLAKDFAYIVIGAYVLSLMYILWLYDRDFFMRKGPKEDHPKDLPRWLRIPQETHDSPSLKKGIEIPIVLIAVIVILFCLSKFGDLTRLPRYLLPLYSTLPIFLAIFLLRIKKTFPLLFVFLLASVLGVSLFGIANIHRYARLEERAFQTFLGILKDRHIQHIRTEYWMAYKITFASNEEVICSPDLFPYGEDKYPEYSHQVEGNPNRAYLTKIGTSQDEHVKRNLESKDSGPSYNNIKYFYSLYYATDK